MFDRVLHLPPDYLGCFAVVLRGKNRNIEICQTDYSIPSKLEFSHYAEVIQGGTTFKLTKGLQRLNKNYRLFHFLFLLFRFLHSNVPDNTYHRQKWHVLFFTCIELVARVLARVCAIAQIKWIRLSHAPTHGSIYLGMVLLHVQNFIWR